MELEVLSFTIGAVMAGGFLGFGILLGILSNGEVFARQVKDEPFDPNEEVMDDKFFEDQWKSDNDNELEITEFPSDEILEELDRLHRHSEF